MHSKDGVRIFYPGPASFQIQNGVYIVRVFWRILKSWRFER